MDKGGGTGTSFHLSRHRAFWSEPLVQNHGAWVLASMSDEVQTANNHVLQCSCNTMERMDSHLSSLNLFQAFFEMTVM